MLIPLHRTFSRFALRREDELETDWSDYLRRDGEGATWQDVHEQPLVVVLGEAGIGKTSEFSAECARLRDAGQFAFFLPLNQLADSASWELVLSGSQEQYDQWMASSEVAYFFLDAVDEARLTSHVAFEKALLVVAHALGNGIGRARIAISSRISDWTVLEVRSSVTTRIALPIARARVRAEAPAAHESAVQETVSISASVRVESIEPYVVTLDPLSEVEARRCADEFGVEEAELFWTAVSEGDYWFMATRPLDLRWMVVLWNKRRTFGTYSELISSNVEERLREVNPNYEAAGAALSPAEMHDGAVALAAAAEFGGYQYFRLERQSPTTAGGLSPEDVLRDWKPLHVRRLMSTALFDEASLGRVKFHHRAVREYLAALWVSRQVSAGTPLHYLKPLFVANPYSFDVLLSARRAALSWLAALNVKVREWVVRDFPALLLYEGDPESWDRASVDAALAGFFAFSRRGLITDWYASGSEYARLARAATASVMADAIADKTLPERARSYCYQVAKFGRLEECAGVCFNTYADSTAETWERVQALDCLEVIGTAAHRELVMKDLRSGGLSSNELIGAALAVVAWESLSADELARVFLTTVSEQSYGPMTRAIKDLLPSTNLQSATLLLEGMLAVFPAAPPGKRFARYPDERSPERAWIVEVLPDSFERLLSLLPPGDQAYPTVCLDAAGILESLRDSGFVDADDFTRVSALIAAQPALRWDIALAVAMSGDITHSVSRLTWGTHCIVSFDVSDLDALCAKANDEHASSEERKVWFEVALFVAFRSFEGRRRVRELRKLGLDGATGERTEAVLHLYRQRCQIARQQRQWAKDDRARKAKAAEEHALLVAAVRGQLDAIRAGTHEGGLQRLLAYSFNRSSPRSYSNVDFEVISNDFGPDLSEAFKLGLMAYWQTIEPPNPANYSDGRVPWSALIALAGIKAASDGMGLGAISGDQADRLARLAIWELDGFPEWFEGVFRAHSGRVVSALAPWILDEVTSPDGKFGVRGLLQPTLRLASDIRRHLLAPSLPSLLQGAVCNPSTALELLNAAREDGLLSPVDVAKLCEATLAASKDSFGHLTSLKWLSPWLAVGPTAAWNWTVAHLGAIADECAELKALAEGLGAFKWVPAPLTPEAADVLVAIHQRVKNCVARAPEEDSQSQDVFGPPLKQLRDGVLNLVASSRGSVAHGAMLRILREYESTEAYAWVRSRMIDQAAQDAALVGNRSVSDLFSIASPFASAPQSEAALFQQVIARLEEIRLNLEEGPFSERDLFPAGIPEKFIQRWLAAKFRETENLRFSVHREEEVDDDKKTDIQLACHGGNVCVEIKPVDKERAYSATSLVDTLRIQMVGQYLRGTNSSRGVLVLMRLDDKSWDVPEKGSRQSFGDLVAYLQRQAEEIRRETGVAELVVFPMNARL